MSERLFEGISSFPRSGAEAAVAIGNFDGVHRGHQHVLRQLVAQAAVQNLQPVVLTFHPHPAEVLGTRTVTKLTRLERKLELLHAIDRALGVVVEPFTRQLARCSASDFAALLRNALRARYVAVGSNFRFGKDRAGDFRSLQALGAELGFVAAEQGEEGDAAGTFSSTRVRAALERGAVEEAKEVLGRPHCFSGKVVRGDQRGRTLGFPTANLVEIEEALPAQGVYACAVDWRRAGAYEALGVGALNIGVRPTVAAGYSAEIHLLNLEADLYESELRLHLITRLRKEQRFSGLDELKAQIGRDVAAVAKQLDGWVPPAHGGWF